MVISTPSDSPGTARSVICERVVFAFAWWTIAVQVTVLTQGNLFDLLAAFVLLGVLAWILVRPLLGRQRPATVRASPAQPAQQALFWLVAIVAIGLTLTAHRANWDDTFYLNLAVSAADMPAEPIQLLDRQHAVEREVPIKRSARLSSIGTLGATLSFLTGIPVIALFHLVLPPLAALCVLLANRELFRILTPKIWGFGVLALVVFLFADGEAVRSYGNFSFVRLHQGKGVLLSACVPLVIAYALAFALRPTRRGWLRLAAIQVAAVGCSSSALIVAPVVAALGLLTGVAGRSSRRFATLLSGLLSSGYIVGLAVWARLELITGFMSQGAGVVLDPSVALSRHVELVSGDGRFSLLYGFVLLTAWLWCGTPLARRLCLIFPAMVGLLFLNPLFADAIAKYTIPTAVYWRVLWLLPLPVMTALTLTAPLTLKRRSNVDPRLRFGLFLLLLAMLPLLSGQTTLSADNGVEMRWPGLKVSAEYEIGRRVSDLVEGRPTVLAPQTVSLWLPTMHHHPYPLVSRFFYANPSRFGEQLGQRLALQRYISGRSEEPMKTERFQHELERYRVECVVLERSNPWREEIRQTLAISDFKWIEVRMNHEIWLRRTATSAQAGTEL